MSRWIIGQSPTDATGIDKLLNLDAVSRVEFVTSNPGRVIFYTDGNNGVAYDLGSDIATARAVVVMLLGAVDVDIYG